MMTQKGVQFIILSKLFKNGLAFLVLLVFSELRQQPGLNVNIQSYTPREN